MGLMHSDKNTQASCILRAAMIENRCFVGSMLCLRLRLLSILFFLQPDFPHTRMYLKVFYIKMCHLSVCVREKETASEQQFPAAPHSTGSRLHDGPLDENNPE